MKKTLIIAASILAIAGCKKAELSTEQGQEDLITRKVSLAAEVAPASDDATVKSFFDTDDKSVKLTGAEELAVAYSNADESKYVDGKPVVAGIIKGTSDGKSNYTFSHNAISGATGYNYYFILPYRDTKNISTNSTKTGPYVKLDSIQHPTAKSFDPLQDYIMGKPIYNAEAQATEITAENLKLKRLFALVRVTLSDEKKVLGGEPLQKVSIGFPAAKDNKVSGLNHKKNNLINLCYLNFDETFSNAGVSGYGDWGSVHASASVTAEYAEGLAAGTDGKYTVWYVTMPVEKAKDTELTVVAQSKNKKVTRKIALPSDMQLQAGVINDLKINITGDGYAVEDTADPNDYWSIYNAGQDIVAGGLTINKSKYSNATLLSGDQVTRDNLQKGGLIFVDGDWTSTGHLKLAKGTIIIGRYKDKQPSISMTSSHAIYLDNGDIILKNLNIGGQTAGRLLVMSGDNTSESIYEYAVVEDCNITALKNVCGYASSTPSYVIKNLSFINCIIKLAGTDANYVVINISKLSAKDTDSSVYKKIEKFEISNCVIYAEQPYPYSDTKGVPTRRMLMDLGSGASGGQYDFPLENAKIVVSNNTLYNINTNGGVLARAYYCKSAEVDGNVVYIDYSSLASTGTDASTGIATYPFTASYMFGIYSGLNNANNGTYSIDNNYSYGYHTAEQSTYITSTSTLSGNTVKWKYRKSKKVNGTTVYDSPDYTTKNSKQENGTNQNYPFTTVDINKGYFPVNSSNIKNATGASYDTKYWVK
ncbi:MAG: DUF4957 domain-containing protein [Candidatus Cryptobacteroides sp.]|nr:DUF4957 domain-containing protein [Candidatus Cryptobacteroides sp.]